MFLNSLLIQLYLTFPNKYLRNRFKNRYLKLIPFKLRLYQKGIGSRVTFLLIQLKYLYVRHIIRKLKHFVTLIRKCSVLTVSSMKTTNPMKQFQQIKLAKRKNTYLTNHLKRHCPKKTKSNIKSLGLKIIYRSLRNQLIRTEVKLVRSLMKLGVR